MDFKTRFQDYSGQVYHKRMLLLERCDLTSLKGCPKEIPGTFSCSMNKLKTLEGCPEIINDNFFCGYNDIISLKDSPKYVKNNYYCNNNHLESLKYAPKEINGEFDCSNNNLTSLEYCPKKIKNVLRCVGNEKIKNIKEEIIKHQIKTQFYYTDEGSFTFKDIEKEFKKYGREQIKKLKLAKKMFETTSYGLGI